MGERLRVGREAAGLDINDVGTRTRIPLRHLLAIERSDYAALPSSTYAIGFTKSYARAVGMDETAIASDLRTELGREPVGAHEREAYEPVDPSRVPSRLLAWTAAALALVFVLGYGAYYGWRNGYFDRESTPAVAAAPAPDTSTPAPAAAPAQPVAAAPSATGQVVLTAIAPVWLRITDSSKTKLFEKEMAAGESYQVPMTASDPKILTGRPDGIKVTIDGREVAALGPPQKTIRDVGISAAALAARAPAPSPAAAPATVPLATPVPGAAH